MKNILIILSLASILLFRLFSIAPFDPPDEQSHLAQINFYVAESRMPNIDDTTTLSQEETFTERVIGTMSEGENKYFFHPEYRYDLVPGYIGKYEKILDDYNTIAQRSTYVVQQSSMYPPLYYWFTSLFYRLGGNLNFFFRLYISRFSSLLFTLFIPLVAHYFAKTIWDKGVFSRTLPYLVFLFPMTTYLGVGVNSDDLHFLLFGIALFLFIKIIKLGYTRNLALWGGILIGLDLLTKPQSYTLLPILALAIIIRWRWAEWKTILISGFYTLVPVLLIAGWQEIPKFVMGSDAAETTAYLARSINYGGWDNFVIFGKDYLRTHLTEVIVWYWGVFKWSGIILPRFFWWIANRLILVSFAGIVLHMIKDLRAKSFGYVSKVMLFSLMSNAIYIFAIFMFDWQFYQEYGHSLGLQARYYLPLLIPQMFLILSGLAEFAPSKKLLTWLTTSLILFFLAMHLTSVYVQLKSYYDLWPIPRLIEQLSQYRPIIAKGAWWYLWFILYLAGIITATTFALKSDSKK